MRCFRWLSAGDIPGRYDLRNCGWSLLVAGETATRLVPAFLKMPDSLDAIDGAWERAATVVIGVESSMDRTRLLARGFGEAVGSGITRDELEQRALRVVRAIEAVPRRRNHGPLELDLLLRDGFVRGQRLGLHPREFGLLWRLAQAPGQPVTPQDLLAEVWRMNFRPETNSLAVHVCRLRAKLASVGLSGIVCTTPEGCYALNSPVDFPIPLAGRREVIESWRQNPGARSGRREKTE